MSAPTTDQPAAEVAITGLALDTSPGLVDSQLKPGDEDPGRGGFAVHLDVFEGPFDLLLSLIAKRRLDVTLVALSQVTDEFIGYIRAAGELWDLNQASEFLVIAATLLDLKIARLLPSNVVEDEEDLALLEARDLLFARLLQYRAYRKVAAWLQARFEEHSRVWPRAVSLEPDLRDLMPPTVLDLTATQFAAVYARAERPRPAPIVDLGHLHAPTVSVREQAVILSGRLRSAGTATFRHLIADCTATIEVVARFLAALELYREGLVLFDQIEPLGELQLRWAGREAAVEIDLTAVDDYAADPTLPRQPAAAVGKPARSD